MFPVTPSDEITAVWRAARPDLELEGMEVFGRLRRLQALYDLEMDSLHGGAPLSSAELDVLVIMRHAGEPMIARGLAVLRGCSRAAMSGILGKLEKRGLITRDPNPADRRASLVRLSDTGSKLVDEVFPRRLAVENRLLSSLTPDDRAAVTAALDLLIKAMLRQSPLSGDVDS
ncbi:DNA-binding MarR family transcriptional regulator [Actinoplanes lutulentus]|uniref:MarR family transcriptional regulator n=1 Tax=Actinoplanes lutulentus TaxID=1287878 RepID=A0A327Z3D5_9ACTN|nr:MarR family transcriptional regulator [Actinoplanes lutulentus]MBB2946359.1 DNA-binding MarR family transcriptional regulator [Actinoplanes lutulentus]RAK28701.1 MarR family transcriptional regulator [Actinoplanes lutulentus]